MTIITANLFFTFLSFAIAGYLFLLPTKENLTINICKERYIGTTLSLVGFYWLGKYTNIFDNNEAQTFLEKVFVYYNFAILPLTAVVYWLNSYLLPRAFICLYILSSYEIINQTFIEGVNSISRFFISIIVYFIVIMGTYIFAKPWFLYKIESKFKNKPKVFKISALCFVIFPCLIFLLSVISSKDF